MWCVTAFVVKLKHIPSGQMVVGTQLESRVSSLLDLARAPTNCVSAATDRSGGSFCDSL